MTYPTEGGGRRGPSDPAVTRGVIVLIVAALVGIVLLAGSGSFTAKNASTKKDTTTLSTGGATTTATTTTPPASTTHPPSEVKVLVLNGTGGQLPTAGSDNTKKLTPGGYATLPPNDAATAAQSHVYFTPGYEPDATAIAKVLGLPATAVAAMPTPLPSPDAAPANVVVLIGADQSSGGATTTGGSTTGGSTTGGGTTGGTTTGGASTGGTTTGGNSTGGTTG